MKNWWKLLQGEKELSSKEIQEAIDELKTKQADRASKVKELVTKLKTARLSVLAGGGDPEGLASIEKAFNHAQSDKDILKEAIVDLSIKLAAVIEQEAIKDIQNIDLDIKKLESKQETIRQEFLIAAGRAVGLWRQIEMRNSFTAGLNTRPWTMNAKEEEPFIKAIEDSAGDKKSLVAQIQELKVRKVSLIKEMIPAQKRKALGLNKIPVNYL